ncbi:hypothetical protein EPUL_003475 [Erysiphe pulchra]|uniref:ATP-dependent DNA helicase n=1 Tax=Erysiphe pulchra TaxID=225359 RepID=A0A2S4PXC7_9PEZI|nr:hypothetical protein EPUL_003475 [Erysiphe pulchra]
MSRSHLYSGVIDALRTDSGTQIGEPVILASSYIGGDRHMTKCFQNAMAITRAIGNPSLVLNFTANPSWPEIPENLEHHQTSDTLPDLIAKVFKLKLDQYLHDVKERNVCGTTIGSQLSIEYQKRGLPHGHLLLFLHPDCVPCTPEQVDQLVRARILTDDPVLAAIVKSQLTHDEKCSKGYPKRWCEATVLRENSYPEYTRPDNGVRWGTERLMFDNCWIVPYNPYLTKKYGAHLNVEVACEDAIKYLSKYIYKGSDRATLAVPGVHNEIDMTLQGRYIRPVQAIWRLMGYTTHKEKPAVMQLPYHLEGRHRVAFSRVMTREQIASTVESQSSAFIVWMKYYAANTDGRDLFYIDFPIHYTYVKNRGWHMRKKGYTIERLPVAVPRQEEHFYLRTLLTVKRRATSYKDLYTVNGVNYETPSAACRASGLGLIFDDSEWISLFNEIKDSTSAAYLRNQFGVIVVNSEVLDPQSIWDHFRDAFSDDCLFRISSLGRDLDAPPLEWSEEERRYDFALWLLRDVFQDLGLDLATARFAKYRHSWIVRERNALIAEAIDFDQEMERQIFSNSVTLFSSGQRDSFDTIMHTINNDLKPNTFFLQGPAGTGKTFLHKTLCSQFRSEGKIMLCVASSGIASLLLPIGRTAHSLFKIPIACTEDSVCHIPAQSQLANLLRRTALIIWDEVTMQSKYNFSAVDKVLRDLCDWSELFGAIPVLLGGDFAQISPVVLRGRREQVVNACIRSWLGWSSVNPLFLTQNMRVINGPENRRFADWLSALPYTPSMYGSLVIPEWINSTNDRTVFREFIYPARQLQSLDTSIFHD